MNAADFPRAGLHDAIAALSAMPGYLEAAIAALQPFDGDAVAP